MISLLSRALFLCFGTFCLFNGIIISMTSNMNLGNILTFLLGVVLLFVGAFWNRLKGNVPKWLKILFFVLLCIVLVFSSGLYFYGKNDNAHFDEDAVIVLGAGLRGDRPSTTLKGRLNAAYEYHLENPDALIIVSGGQGHDEDITEAEAMKKYLVALGIPDDRIVKEEKSTSTYEKRFLIHSVKIKKLHT